MNYVILSIVYLLRSSHFYNAAPSKLGIIPYSFLRTQCCNVKQYQEKITRRVNLQ